MIHKYQNLINALQIFDESWLLDLGWEYNCNALKSQVNSTPSLPRILRSEFNQLLVERKPQWKAISDQAFLFSNTEIYTDWQIKVVIEYILQEYLYPEQDNKIANWNAMENRIRIVLQNMEGWVEFKSLIDTLKLDTPSLKAYEIYDYPKHVSFKLSLRNIIDYPIWSFHPVKIKTNGNKEKFVPYLGLFLDESK